MKKLLFHICIIINIIVTINAQEIAQFQKNYINNYLNPIANNEKLEKTEIVNSSFDIIGQWNSGPSTSNITKDNYLFASMGGAIKVFDISNLDEITQIGEIYLGTSARNIIIEGNYAYLAGGYSGMIIIDISNPSEPHIISKTSLDDITYTYDLNVNGNYAFMANNRKGFSIVDISNKSNPIIIKTINIDNLSVKDIFIQDNYAYVIMDNGIDGYLTVFDITLLSQPVQISAEVMVYSRTFSAGGQSGCDILVNGNYAYIGEYNGTMVVFNISDPTSPFIVGYIHKSNYSALSMSLCLHDNYLFITQGPSGLQIANISDPENIQEASFLSPEYRDYELDVSYANNSVFVSNFIYGIKVVDVTDPQSPILTHTFGYGNCLNSVSVNSNYAFATDWANGVLVFDVTNVTSPKKVSFIEGKYLVKSIIINNKLFLLKKYSLDVFDISNPKAPNKLVTYESRFVLSSMDIVGNTVFITRAGFGYEIVDFSDVSNPVQLSFNNIEGTIHNIKVVNNKAYIATGLRGLQIYDVTNFSSPNKIGEYLTDQNLQYVYIEDNYAFLSIENYGLKIIDVSSPSAPVLLSDFEYSGSTHSMIISNTYLYIANGKLGMRVVDISDKISPIDLGTVNTGGEIFDVDIEANNIFAIDPLNGMFIISNNLLKNVQEENRQFTLKQNFPNPFNPTTTISYSLPQNGFVQLKIYDILGKEVAVLVNKEQASGNHIVKFNANNLPSGIYFYSLKSSSYTVTKKLIILK